jgi:pimeloyl-ACP methyl ester carboxylesterase
LHGYVQNAHAFDAIAPILASGTRFFALDLRGRGASDWSQPNSYRWSYYFRDLQGFLAALGLERVALIGTSLGGTLALLYALAHPRQVSALVLNDIALGADIAGVNNAARRIGGAPTTFADLTSATSWFLRERSGLERLDERQRRSWISHFLTPTTAGQLRFNCDPALILAARSVSQEALPLIPWWHHWTVWKQAQRLTMPVLVLRGEKSDVVPRASADRMVHMLPVCQSREIPGSGHAPTLYEPEAQVAIKHFFGISTVREPVWRLK